MNGLFTFNNAYSYFALLKLHKQLKRTSSYFKNHIYTDRHVYSGVPNCHVHTPILSGTIFPTTRSLIGTTRLLIFKKNPPNNMKMWKIESLFSLSRNLDIFLACENTFGMQIIKFLLSIPLIRF